MATVVLSDIITPEFIVCGNKMCGRRLFVWDRTNGDGGVRLSVKCPRCHEHWVVRLNRNGAYVDRLHKTHTSLD
jgi:hypothetical protein